MVDFDIQKIHVQARHREVKGRYEFIQGDIYIIPPQTPWKRFKRRVVGWLIRLRLLDPGKEEFT